jgi:cell division topological specificity factor
MAGREGRVSRFIPQTPVGSAPVARARLQSLLEYDRSLIRHADLLSVLREEIFALIERHAVIDANKVHFMVVRGNTASTLTVDIEVPFQVRATGTRYAHDGEDLFSYP